MADGIGEVERSASKAERSIDKYSGRLGALADIAITLGPALIPIGAVGIPALTGLASSFGFAALGAGTAVAAFQGVGDALKALNKANLEPTAENLQAAQMAMDQISPAAQKFTKQLQSMGPELKGLRDAAAEGMFPGLAEGLDSIEKVFPKIQRIMGAVGGELGSIGADAGASLASPRWAEFFSFLEKEAPHALRQMADGVGNVAHAAAEMWMAFAPLNHDFGDWMVKATGDLDKWATGLSKTQGFAEFIDYVRTTGPQVGAALGAIGNALVQIIQAAAPIGGPVLQAITAFANVIAKVADSDLGTPIMAAVIAMRLFSRASQVAAASTETAFGARAIANTKSFGSSIIGVTTAEQRASRSVAESTRLHRERMATMAKGAGVIALLGAVSTGAADKMGVANTATLALAGSFVGPWGAAAGAAAGAALDLSHANDGLSDSLERLSQMAGHVSLAAFNKQLSDAQKRIDDLKHTSGFMDTLSDTAKAFGNALTHPGQTHLGQVGAAQAQKDAAEAANDAALRERGAAAANRSLAASSGLAAQGFQLTAAGAREAAGGLTAFTAAATRANNVISHQGSWDAYRQSLLDAEDAIKQNGKTLTKNGDVIRGQGRDVQRLGLESRGTLRTIASGALQTAEGMKDVGKHIKFIDDARGKFIQVAKAMGASGPAARRMASDFGLVNGATRTSAASVSDLNAKIRGLKGKIVDAKAKGAKESSPEVQGLRAAIAALRDKIVKVKQQGAAEAQAAINGVHGSTVVITVRRNFVGGPHPIAEGGTVPGAREPYGDKVHTFLAPGEEVISNRYGQADRHRELLRAINANALAGGGTVRAEDGTYVPAGFYDSDGGARRRGRHNNDDGDTRHHKALQHAIAQTTKAIDKNKAAIDKEKTARDDLVSKRNELASTVGGKFTTDLFGSQPANLSWMNPAQRQAALTGDVFSTLKSDIANANTFKSTLTSLKNRGLDGQALADLAASGDIQRAQAFANLSGKDLGRYETLFNQRAAAASTVGATAGNAVYGAQITAQTKLIATQTAEIKGLRADIHWMQKHQRPITVNDKSGSPHKTAKEVSRQQAMGR